MESGLSPHVGRLPGRLHRDGDQVGDRVDGDRVSSVDRAGVDRRGVIDGDKVLSTRER